MTTSTTDAEAIAQIIVDDFSDIIETAKRVADRTRSTFVIHREKATVMVTGRILSYLASRREAQEPVAYAIFTEDGNIRIWWPAGQRERAERYARETGLVLTCLYTAPPAPALEISRYYCTDCESHISELYNCRCSCGSGRVVSSPAPAGEVERLRAAASALADWAEHEVGADVDLTPGLKDVRAALNGGRAE